MKTPTKEEIKAEMEAYNNDEVGLENPITMEEAEYNLLNSDKYYYQCDCNKNYGNKELQGSHDIDCKSRKLYE